MKYHLNWQLWDFFLQHLNIAACALSIDMIDPLSIWDLACRDSWEEDKTRGMTTTAAQIYINSVERKRKKKNKICMIYLEKRPCFPSHAKRHLVRHGSSSLSQLTNTSDEVLSSANAYTLSNILIVLFKCFEKERNKRKPNHSRSRNCSVHSHRITGSP